VDEVLLGQPGPAVGFMNGIFPGSWQGLVLYTSFPYWHTRYPCTCSLWR